MIVSILINRIDRSNITFIFDSIKKINRIKLTVVLVMAGLLLNF